jgi:holo-[acyl-carrier protein] synthase
MIAGIGTDLCDCRRMRESLERHGERFAERVLGEGELAVFQQRHASNPEFGIRYLATRFAAKEALSKALGLGIRPPMTWRACETLNDELGRPFMRLHGELAAWMAQRQWRAHVSLSDDGDYALAHVIVEHHPDTSPNSTPPTPASP